MKLYPFKIVMSSLIALVSVCAIAYNKAPTLFDTLHKYKGGITNE